MEVQDWSSEEAQSFLRSQVVGTEGAISAVCKELSNVPLALDQAAAYMRVASIDAPKYLTRLGMREGSNQILDSGRAFNREDSAATTWSISIDAAEAEAEAEGARDLLALCSFYAGGAIPRQLPTALASVNVEHPAPRKSRGCGPVQPRRSPNGSRSPAAPSRPTSATSSPNSKSDPERTSPASPPTARAPLRRDNLHQAFRPDMTTAPGLSVHGFQQPSGNARSPSSLGCHGTTSSSASPASTSADS